MKANFRRGLHRLKNGLIRKAPLVCTIVGAAGVVATGVLSARAAVRASDILDEYDRKNRIAVNPTEEWQEPELSIWDEIKLTWKEWILPIGVGAISIGAIIFSHGLSRKAIASLSASNAMLAASLSDMKGAVKELPEAQQKEIGDKLRKKTHKDDEHVVVLDPNGQLYFDEETKVEFRQSPEMMGEAVYKFNRNFELRGYATMGELYEFYGFPKEMIPNHFYEWEWSFDLGNDDGYSWIDIYVSGSDGVISYPGVTPDPEDEIMNIYYPFSPRSIYYDEEVDCGIRADLVPLPAWSSFNVA